MGLVDAVRSWFGGARTKAHAASQWGEMWLRGQEYLLLPDTVVSPYVQVATVYTAIDSIASAVAKVPIVLRRGERIVTEHPMLDMLRRPDVGMTGDQMIAGSVASLLIHGEVFWLPDRVATNLASSDRERVPRAMLLLRPSNMTHDAPDGSLRGWEYTATRTGTLRLRPDEIITARRHNPYSDYRGLSPLSAAAIEYQIEYRSGAWNSRFFENGARPPGYIYSPPTQGSISLTQRQDAQRAFEEEYSGLSRAHRWPVLGPGKELRPFALSQKDMDFLEGRRFSREQILAVFRVPPSIAGVFEYANYAVAAEQKRYFWANAVRPAVNLIQAMLDELTQRYMPSYSLMLDIEAAIEKDIPEDYGARVDTMLKLLAVGVPLAQLNDKMRLGFDLSAVPHADISLLSGGYRRADDVLDPTPAGALSDEMSERRVLRGAASLTWAHYKARLDGYESACYRRLVPLLNAAETATLASLPKQAITRDAADVFPPGFADDVERELVPIIVRILRESGEQLMIEAGSSVEFDWRDPSVSAQLTQRRVMIRGASLRMRAELREALARAIEKGESWERMREIVHDMFDGFRHNARTIARTEVNAAFSGARIEAMGQAGIREQQWLAATDDFVRDTHRVLDGAVARVGTTEWVKDGQRIVTPLRYPHDPQAPASETINCRCVCVALVDR